MTESYTGSGQLPAGATWPQAHSLCFLLHALGLVCESPGRSHHGNLLTTHARGLTPHKSYLWPDGVRGLSWAGRWTLSSFSPWADSAETFMQLYVQPWPSNRTSLNLAFPLSLLHSPVTHPLLHQIPNLRWPQALLSGKTSLRQNWLKTRQKK